MAEQRAEAPRLEPVRMARGVQTRVSRWPSSSQMPMAEVYAPGTSSRGTEVGVHSMCALEAAFNMTMGKISKQPLSLGPRGLQGWSVEGFSQEHMTYLSVQHEGHRG